MQLLVQFYCVDGVQKAVNDAPCQQLSIRTNLVRSGGVTNTVVLQLLHVWKWKVHPCLFSRHPG